MLLIRFFSIITGNHLVTKNADTVMYVLRYKRLGKNTGKSACASIERKRTTQPLIVRTYSLMCNAVYRH